jgi:hypothetical protein
MHSLNGKFYLSEFDKDPATVKHSLHRDSTSVALTENPTLHYIDPCQSLFVKFGGTVFRRNQLHPRTVKIVKRITSRDHDEVVSKRKKLKLNHNVFMNPTNDKFTGEDNLLVKALKEVLEFYTF